MSLAPLFCVMMFGSQVALSIVVARMIRVVARMPRQAPSGPDPDSVLGRLDQVLERLSAAASTAVDVGATLRDTAGDVSRDLTTAATLQAAQFGRLDVLVDKLTDEVRRARAEAAFEAGRVAENLGVATGHLEDQAAAADAAAKKPGAESGSVADAGAQTPKPRPRKKRP